MRDKRLRGDTRTCEEIAGMCSVCGEETCDAIMVTCRSRCLHITFSTFQPCLSVCLWLADSRQKNQFPYSKPEPTLPL